LKSYSSKTELGLLDNAQVVYMVMGTVTALGALLAVVLGSDTVARFHVKLGMLR
jgi:hypothetical protein